MINFNRARGIILEIIDICLEKYSQIIIFQKEFYVDDFLKSSVSVLILT